VIVDEMSKGYLRKIIEHPDKRVKTSNNMCTCA
jgi:hypothetical protein